MSTKYIDNIVNLFEGGNDKKNKDNDKKNDKKLNFIKKFIKDCKNKYKTYKDFYEKEITFFKNNGINDYSAFINIVNQIEIEEKQEKINKKNEEEKLKIKRETNIKKINVNNFTIISNKKYNSLTIVNEFKYFSKPNRIFKNSVLKIEPNIHGYNINKINKNYSKLLQKKINEYNIIPNMNNYYKNKNNSYIIEKINNEKINNTKKIKYNDSELIIILNHINISCDRTKNKIENITENGLCINDLRLTKKLKNDSTPPTHPDAKIIKMIEEIQNNSIITKIIKEKKVPSNYMLCINCYECFNNKEINNHIEHFVLKIEDFKTDEDELDYNTKLQIIYENLKNLQKKIIKTGNTKILKYYGKLLSSLYDIICNNNSYEELNLSLMNINDNFMNIYESKDVSTNFKDLFLIFCQKISHLTYLKIKELSFPEIDDDKETNFSEL